DAGAVWCWEADELWRPTPARAIAADSLGAIVQLVSAPRSPGGPALHCARQRSGGVSCWGAGAWHIDVDRGEDEPRALPGAANVRDLAVDRRLCVVLEGGAVRCSADEYAAPLRPIAGITDAVAVEVFGADLCALGRGGVRCAGPSYGAANDSVAVTGLGDVARLVAIEGAHCAVEPEGRHRCWGPGPAPRAHRMPELEGVRAVAERCAVHDDGRVSCWVHPRSCDSLPLCGQEPRLRDGR
ncbi:MAG: hypothetical protein KC486_36465, partial [Myxococcales bacterium]|nr:hypothetical protein [Myxococcales bacterium]